MPIVFACLNIDHPVVAWGAYRGVLVSALAEPAHVGCAVSMMLAGMLLCGSSIRLHNEFEIERVRQNRYPTLPSRLTAMYFFESSRDIERIGEWGDHFSKDYMAELELFPTAPVTRHDSNWISNAELDRMGRIASSDWIDSYWKGEPEPTGIPIWELLAHGRAVVHGTDLRAPAYETIKKHSPMAMSILEVSRIAAILESDLGQMKAFMIDNVNGTASVQYHLDMRDADNPNFLARVGSYVGPKNHRDLSIGGEFFGIPDLQSLTSTFPIDMSFAEDFFSKVHCGAAIEPF